MIVTPDQPLRIPYNSSTRSHEQILSDVCLSVGSGKELRQPEGGRDSELRGGDDNKQHQIERCILKLRGLGLAQVAAIFSWSVIPIAPLFSHLGIVIFGRETKDQPVWWQVLGSSELLAWFSDQLHEE
jgi:hypothetical protein